MSNTMINDLTVGSVPGKLIRFSIPGRFRYVPVFRKFSDFPFCLVKIFTTVKYHPDHLQDFDKLLIGHHSSSPRTSARATGGRRCPGSSAISSPSFWD